MHDQEKWLPFDVYKVKMPRLVQNVSWDDHDVGVLAVPAAIMFNLPHLV